MCRLFNKCNEKSIARNTPVGYLGDNNNNNNNNNTGTYIALLK